MVVSQYLFLKASSAVIFTVSYPTIQVEYYCFRFCSVLFCSTFSGVLLGHLNLMHCKLSYEKQGQQGLPQSGIIYSRSGKSLGVLYQVREFLNLCSTSVNSMLR